MKVAGAILCVVYVSLCVPTVRAATYSGGLTYTPPSPDSSDGLYAEGARWRTYTQTLSWTVTDEDNSFPGFPWKYTYTFGHDGSQAAISHILIEVSDGVEESDFVGVSGATVDSVGLQTVSSGNPSMPEDVIGIRFDPVGVDPLSMTWTFFCNRMPVWGDFYAKDGNIGGGPNIAYNYNQSGIETGFVDPDGNDSVRDDPDPVTGPSDGSVDHHILRPDALVPEPVTVVLFGLGGLAVLVRRK